MASMVQIFNHSHHEQREQYNFEGYNNSIASNSAALMASQFAFNGGAASITHIPCNEQKLVHGGADPAVWEAHRCSPQMQGPFTPVPLGAVPSPACTHPHHPSPFMDACISRGLTADTHIPSFHTASCFDVDFPLSEDNQLLELMGLQRKLTMYSRYGDDGNDHHSQDSMTAAAASANDEEKESFLQACSYAGDEVKLCNLARSFTFPAAGARATPADGSSCAVTLPWILSSDGVEGRRANNVEMKHVNEKRICRDSSSAATTSCSNGDEGDLPQRMDVGVKFESSEVSDSMLSNQAQQGCTEQIGSTLNSRGYKQNRKRATNISSSNASAKAARRLDTPPDVVHVRARRGQATDSHSLAERVRREKISQRMKVLQEIVPGCHKVLGKAMMLDEIINYVKSLQKQVEFLSMKLAAANQATVTSMITNEVKFLLPNVEFFGELSSSCQATRSEPFLNPFIR